jgi:hypothetical protein
MLKLGASSRTAEDPCGTLFFPEPCTHYFEGFQHTLFDLSDTPMDKEASPYRNQLIESFSSGFLLSEEPPYPSPMIPQRNYKDVGEWRPLLGDSQYTTAKTIGTRNLPTCDQRRAIMVGQE